MIYGKNKKKIWPHSLFGRTINRELEQWSDLNFIPMESSKFEFETVPDITLDIWRYFSLIPAYFCDTSLDMQLYYI